MEVFVCQGKLGIVNCICYCKINVFKYGFVEGFKCFVFIVNGCCFDFFQYIGVIMYCILIEYYYVMCQNVCFFYSNGNWYVLIVLVQIVIWIKYDFFIIVNIYCIVNNGVRVFGQMIFINC